MSLESSRGSSFRVAFSAVYWSAWVWFEGNFAFLSALSANCLVHFSVFSVVSQSISHLHAIVNEKLAF